MATKKTTKKTASKKTNRASAAKKAKPAAKRPRPRTKGILDIAAETLASSEKPMGCKEIVEHAIDKGLWKTKGKTPHATLYAAIIREIAAKGKNARFKKVDRGLFTSAGARK
jgi:HB1, ASXL, restriction endonuclease HTH domain